MVRQISYSLTFKCRGSTAVVLLVNQCNWKEIDFPSHKKDWKKFERNNKAIVLNILYLPYNSEKIRPEYVSKHNLKRKNQVILLMVTDGKKWHNLAVKKNICIA